MLHALIMITYIVQGMYERITSHCLRSIVWPEQKQTSAEYKETKVDEIHHHYVQSASRTKPNILTGSGQTCFLCEGLKAWFC